LEGCGALVASWLGSVLGRSVERKLGSLDGLLLSPCVRLRLGALDASRLGFEDGAEVIGDPDGPTDGASLGVLVGASEERVGPMLGMPLGNGLGASDGKDDGNEDGKEEGNSDGKDEGNSDGKDEGNDDGTDNAFREVEGSVDVFSEGAIETEGSDDVFSQGAIETEGSEEVAIALGPEEIDGPREIFPEGIAEDDGFGDTVGVCEGFVEVDGAADGAEDGAPVGSATSFTLLMFIRSSLFSSIKSLKPTLNSDLL
jgi:hypothetical protein